MKKLSILLVLIALVLAACGGGSGAVAATVNGTDVTVAEVESLIASTDASAIPKEEFAAALGFLVQQKIVIEAAESEFGISIPESDVTAEADALIAESSEEGTTREEFLETQGITEELLQTFAHNQLLVEQITESFETDVEPPSQEDIDALVAESEALYCASHILVASEQEANDVASRLEAGEDFATLAAEVSTDTASGAQGGDLGCSPAEPYDPAFAEALTGAEVGVPTVPVESQFGWHIILLRDDELPTDDEAIETLTSRAVSEAANTWFIDQFEAAEVTVDEEYGTWQANPPQVVAPAE